MYRCNTSGTVAARLARVKAVISNIHNVDDWDDAKQLFVDKRLARYKDLIIAVSEGVRRNYLEKTGIAPDRVVTLHNGVDMSGFVDLKPDPSVRRELGIAPGERVVSVLARLVSQKRHLDFLEMAAQVKSRIPNVKFLIAGKGRLREQIEQKATELGISDRVVFAGHRNDVPQLLALTDVFVTCSDREGFSNAILESMAAGAPVVATDVGGNAEAIVTGRSGFIVPVGRPDILADRVTSLLADSGLRSRIAAGARERVSLFTVESMCDATDLVYGEMLKWPTHP